MVGWWGGGSGGGDSGEEGTTVEPPAPRNRVKAGRIKATDEGTRWPLGAYSLTRLEWMP